MTTRLSILASVLTILCVLGIAGLNTTFVTAEDTPTARPSPSSTAAIIGIIECVGATPLTLNGPCPETPISAGGPQGGDGFSPLPLLIAGVAGSLAGGMFVFASRRRVR